jgi:addiction module RelE/StbE family toxin
MRELYFSSSFNRDLKGLLKKNPKIRKVVYSKLKKLSKNPNDRSLRLHKLSGRDCWSISIATDMRVIFGFENEKIYLLRIGSHDEIY